MSQQPSVKRELETLELLLLQPSVRQSERMVELLADSFIEFGSSGQVFTKEQIINNLKAEATPSEFTVTQLNVQLLAPHVALVTYCACRHSEPPINSLRSSVWKQRLGQWQIVFHQGTRAIVLT